MNLPVCVCNSKVDSILTLQMGDRLDGKEWATGKLVSNRHPVTGPRGLDPQLCALADVPSGAWQSGRKFKCSVVVLPCIHSLVNLLTL